MKSWSAILVIAALVGCQAPTPTAENPESLSKSDVKSLSIPERRERFQQRADEKVEYHNPGSNHYKATYTLDVEYNEDGSVKRILFPNGGYIHRFRSQSEQGDTILVIDEDGREFRVPKVDNVAEDVR